eukprot:maker-scaffold697_size109876-snap-gene-0.23 protein:Tk05843 transcript:maker-scaffold697_size109876-snap-gene-0.23-mRNA-1 annotation:"poly(adp-ribose) polymerase pme-5-like"
MKRSLQNDASALSYALSMDDLKAVKLLIQDEQSHSVKPRVSKECCMLASVGTGVYNYRSLGIQKIRRLNMSRGGREGNNAFTKDVDHPYDNTLDFIASKLINMDVSKEMLKELLALKTIQKHELAYLAHEAIYRGSLEVPAWIIETDMKSNVLGSLFNRYHHEALLGSVPNSWKAPIREASARKKGPNGMTPLHCAAINPDISALRQLFLVCPDVNVVDNNQRKLIHYAVGANGLEPIKFLLGHGANLEDVDNKGMTPLMRACEMGRPEMVKFIIETLKDKGDMNLSNPIVKKMGVAGIDRPTKTSWSAINFAVNQGHVEVVELLIHYGVNVERQLNCLHDKITPLMQAACLGHFEIAKTLSNHCKIEKHDRYKRTALTHAVINGSANIASLLLSLGADPNKVDTSKNSNLHYACAYGWYFCMKVLIEAGAELSPCNEWKLTPAAVALLKGHNGIAKHLLALPGVDINFKDDQGRSVLLNMLKSLAQDKPLTPHLWSEMQDMVNHLGADPHAIDHEGRGVLHFLAQFDPRPCWNEMEEGKDNKKYMIIWKKQQVVFEEAVHFFLAKGVDPFQQDKTGYVPLMYAMEVPVNAYGQRYFGVVNKLLQHMMSNIPSGRAFRYLEDQPTLLTVLVVNISIPYIHKWAEVLSTIFSLWDHIKAQEKDARFVDHGNPFYHLCSKYAQSCGDSIVSTEFFTTFDLELKLCKDGRLAHYDKNVQILRQLLFDFLERLQPSVETRSLVKKVIDGKETFVPCMKSAAISLAFTSPGMKAGQDQSAFEEMLEKMPNLKMDILDADGRTPFNQAVLQGRVDVAKVLEKQGANVDHSYISAIKRLVSCEEDVYLRYCPILDATKNGCVEMVKYLISVGADVHLTHSFTLDKDGEEHRESLFFVALANCMSDRKNKSNLAILRSLISVGVDVGYQEPQTLRNALHLAINSSSDSEDQALDLEMALLRSKIDVQAKDIRGRFPLHYAFVKIGRHTNQARCDPIEVVSMLVDAMNQADLDEGDDFGTTPLHYAAFRGATVSCLLLISKGADLNRADSLGNTPLAYAVLGGHEGCSLILLQKGANIHVDIHELERTEDIRSPKSGAHSKIPRQDLSQYEYSFSCENAPKRKQYTLFEGLIQNGWLGITYMALEQLEKFGMPYARAIEIALFLQKIQFAKTLIGKQVSVTKLREKLSATARNLITCLSHECQHDSNPDIQPLCHIRRGFETEGLRGCHNFLNLADDASDSIAPILTTALSVAVVFRNHSLIQKTLTNPQNQADINVADGLGMTPIMHAVKANDSEILIQLLSGGDSEHFGKGKEAKRKFRVDLNVDLQTLDHSGRSVFHHLIGLDQESSFPVTYDNEDILNILLKAARKRDLDKSISQAFLNQASSLGNQRIVRRLSQEFSHLKAPQLGSTHQVVPPGVEDCVAWDCDFSYDVNQDARAMLAVLEQREREKAKISSISQSQVEEGSDTDEDSNSQASPSPSEDGMDIDEESNEPKPRGLVIKEGHIQDKYSVLMTKIDVSFGAWGLYNFYRMQIWKDKHKNLWILFTNWGRIGDFRGGQYQNTPFGDPHQAIEEFEKTFKAKSGNEWSVVGNGGFEEKPRKYRVIDIDKLVPVKKSALKFDLASTTPSKLPPVVQSMIADIADVSMYVNLGKEIGNDPESMPFGRIKRAKIESARDILDKIKSLIEDKTAIELKRQSNSSTALQDQLFECVDAISKLSTEFYYLLPQKGFEFTQVCPIDNVQLCQSAMLRVLNNLDLEAAERLLLGAQFRKEEINPLDYIYRAFKCKIRSITPSCEEAKYILKYMGNSEDLVKNVTVRAMFKIQEISASQAPSGFLLAEAPPTPDR